MHKSFELNEMKARMRMPFFVGSYFSKQAHLMFYIYDLKQNYDDVNISPSVQVVIAGGIDCSGPRFDSGHGLYLLIF